MDSDRNPLQWWQAGPADSDLTDTEGYEEVFQTPNSDGQTLGDEPWQEQLLQQLLSSDFNIGLEDHLPDAEFGSQSRVELNGNYSQASSEPWKNFPVADDGGVATDPDPDPENLGICSRETQGPLPLTNGPTAPQNVTPLRNPKKTRKRPRTDTVRTRAPNWTPDENRWFLQHMEVQTGKSPWEAISISLKAMGSVREAKACEDHWGVLLADLKKFGDHFRSDDILRDQHLWPSVGTMSREQRSQNGLPLGFKEEWFAAIARIDKARSPHRKRSKGRIHVAGTPSCSCRQQPRVSAASAAPSSEIFDNPVGDGDGDGISGLVRLLGSTDRTLTVDQTIEVMRISLEEKKLALRRQEIEWDRERMYEGQRNGQRRPDVDLLLPTNVQANPLQE